jgi:hypothetical protein
MEAICSEDAAYILCTYSDLQLFILSVFSHHDTISGHDGQALNGWQPAILSLFRDSDTRRWLMMGLGFQKCFPLRGGAFKAERISGCATCTRVLGREAHCLVSAASLVGVFYGLEMQYSRNPVCLGCAVM